MSEHESNTSYRFHRDDDLVSNSLLPAEQLTLVDPPEKTVATVFVSQIAGAEEVIPSASLIGSMLKHGQLQPIIVTCNGQADRLPYTVVAGRRRVAAARHLGWEEIDAVIYDEGDINPNEVGLIENAMRSANPLSEYVMIRSLELEGLTDTEITQRTGMPSATIRKRRQLGSLTSGAIKAVYEGRVATGVAEELAKLSRELQNAVLADHPEGRITGKDVREAREVQRQAGWVSLGMTAFDPHVETELPWKVAAISHLEAAMSVIPDSSPGWAVGSDITILIGRIRDLEGGGDAEV